MNTLWRLGKATRPTAETPKELAPIAWPPLRALADFATEATFTAPHTDDELLARRLWRNVEYYQTNYACLLGVGLLLSVAADSFTLVRLAGLALGLVAILHVAADRAVLPTEAEARRRWLGLVDAVASRVTASPLPRAAKLRACVYVRACARARARERAAPGVLTMLPSALTTEAGS